MLTQPGPHSAENKAETPPLLAVERVHQQGDGLGTEGCRCSRAGLYAACAQRDVKQGKSEALGPWHGSHVLSCKVHCKVLICSLKPSFTASPLILRDVWKTCIPTYYRNHATQAHDSSAFPKTEHSPVTHVQKGQKKAEDASD